ncbi:ABC transporter substrate-binding protein [Actinomadura sp. CNU-125]|uniref:ABC transporter substrate-binding protein n=1 Tax=Actinomadura sp. CNU-125 TaxID=1904961 RepID=UPI0009654511|nr:ABC transporter substrate-binding protein [Actinomadura sp. CNU-125]OLT10958.1 ABC transporter substrate-binding protein [Actinomadura sp. CNU-125]
MSRRYLPLLTGLAALVLAGTACAPEETSTAEAPASCAKEDLNLKTPGKLTVATDKPAFEPWFSGDDPSNGEGFESAVTYAVAEELGFAENEVAWTVQPFDSAYAPGPKKFDFDVNQISVTPERAKAVTFSDGYYTVRQAVVTLGDSKYAGATTMAELKDASIAVQVGTTSLQAVKEQIAPGEQPKVFNTQIDAVNALKNEQVDLLVVDLPTAFYVTAAQIDGAKIVGQLPHRDGDTEHFGLLLERGNPLVSCLNEAIGALKSSGELQKIEDKWLAAEGDAPLLK